MEMNEIVSAKKKTSLSFKGLNPEKTSLIPAQFTFTLDPGYYRICLKAKDLISNRNGSYRISNLIKPLGEGLGIS